jgi:5-methylcytosine-specific restriction protein A
MPMRVCSVTGCGTIYDNAQGSRCAAHRVEADRARGTASQRGYTGAGHRAFRTAVLHRDPICVQCRAAPSTVADHHPLSRRELIARGMNPNDPANGRGLCKPCHDRETAHHQPGGWHH